MTILQKKTEWEGTIDIIPGPGLGRGVAQEIITIVVATVIVIR